MRFSFIDSGGAAILALWILLVALSGVLIVFASIFYFFIMKRQVIFTKIWTFLRIRGMLKVFCFLIKSR